MDWSTVGKWLRDNAGTGAALVGSLLTGNIPGAVAAGVALVSSATGTDDPVIALEQLQTNPETVLKLKELAYQNEADIRRHVEALTLAQLEAEKHEHETTQATIQTGDQVEDKFVRRTRPAQSWLSLSAAIVYAFAAQPVDVYVLGALLTLPFAYMGLRTGDKITRMIGSTRAHA